jgi:membrane associated rhomboid family serine protease
MRLSGRKSSFSTRHWTRPKQIVLLSLIALNAAVFVTQLLLESFYPEFVRDYLGISNAGVHQAYAWQFVSAMFLHSGPWHLVANMLVLYLLGRDLESILGQRHFLYLYLTGAVAGEFGHLFLMPTDSVLFAASGGIAAIICAYAIILPELELTSTGIFALRLKAKHLGTFLWIVCLILLCVDRAPLVVHSALFGGCVAGCLYAHLLGFGVPSCLQRFLRQRRERAERLEHMTVDQLMTEEIDPLLEKIAEHGWIALTKKERRALFRARERILIAER